MMGFIDTMRSRGHAVESVCRVLREQGCQVAARTYRAWRTPGRVLPARTLTDARVVDAVRATAWATDPDGRRMLAPEGLYGRRKMTAYLRRTAIPGASAGAVDRAMRLLGLTGVRRDKGTRTTIQAKDGIRAGDLLDRQFSATAPNKVWVTDITYCRTFAGWVYAAFVTDVYSRRVVGWQLSTSLRTDLALDALEMGIWTRQRDGHDITGVTHHSDKGVQYLAVRYTQRLAEAGAVASVGSTGDSYDCEDEVVPVGL